MRSTVVVMLQNSATQLQRIQEILSEFLEATQAEGADGAELLPHQTRPHQPREPRHRTKIDLGLKVSTLFLLGIYRSKRRVTAKAEVRQHALLMLGRDKKSSPVPDPPEPQVIAQFNLEKTRGPSKRLGQLRLDLDGPVRSPWNVKAAQCFRKNFNKSQLYRRWPNDLIEEAFLRHTETIRAKYHQQIGHVSADAIRDSRIRSSRRSRLKTVNVTSFVFYT